MASMSSAGAGQILECIVQSRYLIDTKIVVPYIMVIVVPRPGAHISWD
jgi:hypothetical protein